MGEETIMVGHLLDAGVPQPTEFPYELMGSDGVSVGHLPDDKSKSAPKPEEANAKKPMQEENADKKSRNGDFPYELMGSDGVSVGHIPSNGSNKGKRKQPVVVSATEHPDICASGCPAKTSKRQKTLEEKKLVLKMPPAPEQPMSMVSFIVCRECKGKFLLNQFKLCDRCRMYNKELQSTVSY
jgi:hypothetical protein